MDAGNILKPALARGKIQVIGATTTSRIHQAYRKRRCLGAPFPAVIQVPETTFLAKHWPSSKGLRKHYEKFHGVTISDEVIGDTVSLAKRYINDRYMPDKAIDLIDETAAHLARQTKARPALKSANCRKN